MNHFDHNAASRTLVDKFRDWDWRLEDLAHWMQDTARYWIDNLGWWGWFGVVAVVMVALLSWDLTRSITNAIITKIANGAIALVGKIAIETLTALAAWTGNASIASARNALRYSLDNSKDEPSTTDAR